MSLQVPAGLKYLVAFIAYMFLFTVVVFVFPVAGKKFLVFELLFAIRTLIDVFAYMGGRMLT